jgi:NCS1 family nucleobase:cation symporter-1
MAFGSKGMILPALIRGILGCFWFGVQAWIGGQAVNAIIGVIIPGWKSIGFPALFISFLIFWAINVYIAGSGSKAVKALQKYSAPVLIILSFTVIFWGLSTADWSLTTLLAEPSLQGDPSSKFWVLFFPALSAMIAFDAGIALSMADFTRHSKSQKSQILGQVIGAPFMTAFIAFVGICGTAGAAIAFNESIWEPAVLVSKFDNPIIVVTFSFFIIMAVLTTNVAANLVPPTNVLSTIFAKKISYKTASLIAASLALLGQPWKTLATPDALIFDVLGILGALLGPISGVFVVAYLFAHKTNVDLVSIYREDGGKYYYSKGWNIELVVITILATILVLSGKFVPSLHFIFDNSYVIGSIGTALIYYIYLRIFKKDIKMTVEDNHDRKESIKSGPSLTDIDYV